MPLLMDLPFSIDGKLLEHSDGLFVSKSSSDTNNAQAWLKLLTVPSMFIEIIWDGEKCLDVALMSCQ